MKPRLIPDERKRPMVCSVHRVMLYEVEPGVAECQFCELNMQRVFAYFRSHPEEASAVQTRADR